MGHVRVARSQAVAGRISGGLSYGYRIANRIDRDGRPVRGPRQIHPAQAETVRRIYRLYADGASTREIAATLNREGEPGPPGGPWASNTINDHRGRRNGILTNDLYRSRLVHGRQRFVRDPDTGKCQARPVPPEKWIVKDVPSCASSATLSGAGSRTAGGPAATAGTARRPGYGPVAASGRRCQRLARRRDHGAQGRSDANFADECAGPPISEQHFALEHERIFRRT